MKKNASPRRRVNRRRLALLNPEEVPVVIRLAAEADVDELWAFVGKKREPRWRWHALDPRRGPVLAYGLGRRTDEVFLRRKAVREPFGLTRY